MAAPAKVPEGIARSWKQMLLKPNDRRLKEPRFQVGHTLAIYWDTVARCMTMRAHACMHSGRLMREALRQLLLCHQRPGVLRALGPLLVDEVLPLAMPGRVVFEYQKLLEPRSHEFQKVCPRINAWLAGLHEVTTVNVFELDAFIVSISSN